jgi:hypothetical protein
MSLAPPLSLKARLDLEFIKWLDHTAVDKERAINTNEFSSILLKKSFDHRSFPPSDSVSTCKSEPLLCVETTQVRQLVE